MAETRGVIWINGNLASYGSQIDHGYNQGAKPPIHQPLAFNSEWKKISSTTSRNCVGEDRLTVSRTDRMPPLVEATLYASRRKYDASTEAPTEESLG